MMAATVSCNPRRSRRVYSSGQFQMATRRRFHPEPGGLDEISCTGCTHSWVSNREGTISFLSANISIAPIVLDRRPHHELVPLRRMSNLQVLDFAFINASALMYLCCVSYDTCLLHGEYNATIDPLPHNAACSQLRLRNLAMHARHEIPLRREDAM